MPEESVPIMCHFTLGKSIERNGVECSFREITVNEVEKSFLPSGKFNFLPDPQGKNELDFVCQFEIPNFYKSKILTQEGSEWCQFIATDLEKFLNSFKAEEKSQAEKDVKKGIKGFLTDLIVNVYYPEAISKMYGIPLNFYESVNCNKKDMIRVIQTQETKQIINQAREEKNKQTKDSTANEESKKKNIEKLSIPKTTKPLPFGFNGY